MSPAGRVRCVCVLLDVCRGGAGEVRAAPTGEGKPSVSGLSRRADVRAEAEVDRPD